MTHQNTCGRACPGEPECTRTADIVTGRKRSELDYARIGLFAASRALQKAHERRQRWYNKSAPPAEVVQACRDADRELQRAAVRFTAALIAEQPAPGPTVAELVLGVVELIK